MKKVRLSLDVSETDKQMIKDLMEKWRIRTMTIAIVRSIRLAYKITCKLEEDGELFIRKEDGTEVQIIVV